MGQEYIGTKQVTAWPEMKDMLDGFAVQYADGYTSWSPKKVFEEAYLPIGQVKELPPHVQRVICEKAQLDDRLAKLRTFIASPGFDDFPAKSRELLLSQAETMDEYSDLLKQRLELG
jgi:hypothetical protein